MSTKSNNKKKRHKARNKATKRLRVRESERKPRLIMRRKQKRRILFVSYFPNIISPKLFVFYSSRWTSLVSKVLWAQNFNHSRDRKAFFGYLTKIELGVSPVTQWAAVTTHRLLSREPPQNWKPERVRNIACQGQPPGWAWFPPTILVWPVWGRTPQEP